MGSQKSPERHFGAKPSPGAPRAFTLKTLGITRLSHDGPDHREIVVLGPGKLASLLVYLSCAPSRRAVTDHLVELFWPDRDAATGYHDLRQAIWQLRRRLGRDGVTCAHGTIELRAAIVSDRDGYLAAVERGDHERVIAMYAGEFLGGTSMRASEGFERWCHAEQLRLRGAFLHAASEVANDHLRASRFHAAGLIGSRMREADPNDERGWRVLLESALGDGAVSVAAGQADLLTARLKSARRMPERATKALLQQVWRSTIVPAERVQESGILVAPFEWAGSGMSVMPHFTDALTKSVIARLSGLTHPRVIAWAAASKLKGREIDDLPHELGVQHVLSGKVAEAASSIRVEYRLFDVAKQRVIAEHAFTDGVGGTPGLALTIARSVIQDLGLRVGPAESQRMSRGTIEDPHAYECYLRAREVMYHGFNAEALARAVALLRRGLKRGGEHALLYSALGTVYMEYGLVIVDGVRSLRRAEVCARKALALDPESADAHFLAGIVASRRGDIKRGARDLLRALTMDPYHTDALFWCSGWLCCLGAVDRARPLARRLLEIDPLSTANLCIPGWVEWLDGRFAAAIPWYERWTEADPANGVATHSHALALVWNGRFDEAAQLLDLFAAQAPESPWVHYNPFFKHALKGERALALAAITPEIGAAAAPFAFWCWYMAAFHAMIDAREAALEWTERAIGQGFLNYRMLGEHDPFLARLRGDERFVRLVDRAKREAAALEL